MGMWRVGIQAWLVMERERERDDVGMWRVGIQAWLVMVEREREREMVWGCGGLVYKLGL